MKSFAKRVVMFPIELAATLVVCGFIYAVFGGLSASLAGNHRYRI